MKIFLGGTCGESNWREELIPLLEMNDIEYFNPVVKDWTHSCQQEEIRQKEICEGHLYVISKEMTGVFSIAEAVESAMASGKTCFFMVLVDGFDDSQMSSLKATLNLIHRHGGCVCMSTEQPGKFSWLVTQILSERSKSKEIGNFEVGKFYKHKAGRAIAVVGEVKTSKWGTMVVIEETDPTGHSMSVIEKDSKDTLCEWSEISNEQWGLELKKDNRCFFCGKKISSGHQYRETPRGMIHEVCFLEVTQNE